MQKTVEQAFRQIRAQGQEPLQKPFIIDADASSSRVQWSLEFSPCLTGSRHKGHWISNQKRRMNIREMMKFQGMQPESIRREFSDVDLGHMQRYEPEFHPKTIISSLPPPRLAAQKLRRRMGNRQSRYEASANRRCVRPNIGRVRCAGGGTPSQETLG